MTNDAVVERSRRWLHRALHEMPAGGMHGETEMSHACDGGWIDDHDWERIADALIEQGWTPPATEPPATDPETQDAPAWRPVDGAVIGTVPADGARYEVSVEVRMAEPHRRGAVAVRLVDADAEDPNTAVVANAMSAHGGPLHASFVTDRPGRYRPEVFGAQVIDPASLVAVEVDNFDQRPLPDAFMLPMLRPDLSGPGGAEQ